MKKILLVTPYNLTKKEVGGAFTYQFVDRIADNCIIDVILYQYKGDIIDAPQKDNLRILRVNLISKLDRYLSWIQCPIYHPLFTSRYSWRMIYYIRKKIKEEMYDYLVFDYSQTFAMADAIDHPHKLLVAHDVIAQRFERIGSKLLNWIRWSEGRLVCNAEKLYSFSNKDCLLMNKLYQVDCDFTPVFIKQTILDTIPLKCNDYHVFFADWRRDDNSESLEWFLQHVSPKVKNTQFKIIGGGLSPRLKSIIDDYSNMEYLGFVDNPYPLIANAKSEICPLHTGAGIKVKCLEALACGTPVIGTEVAFEGIDNSFSQDLYLANTPDEYVKLIEGLGYTLEEKKRIKSNFISRYSQKSMINYIIQ